MLSQIVFIAFLLAVFIGNSESVTKHKFENDQDVLERIGQFSNGIFPIILFEGNMNPMEYAPPLKEFINENYRDLIIFDNSDNKFPQTYKVLNSRLSKLSTKPFQALFMMRNGRIVASSKPNRVSSFTKHYLNILKSLADDYIPKSIESPTFQKELSTKIDTVRILEEQPVVNPVETLPRPNNQGPQTSATLNRRYDQHQVRGQPTPPTNTQMTIPILYHPNFQMMRSSASGQGQSSGQGQGSGHLRPQTNIQMITPMKDYQSIPITVPYVWLPTMPIQQAPENQQTPPIERTLFKPKPVYATRQLKTQDLLSKMDKRPSRENNLPGSPQTLSQSQGGSHTAKKPRYGGESTSSRSST